MNFSAMLSRAIRAAKLDLSLYREVEHDASLNQEALMVVIIASLLAGIGALIGGLFSGVGFALMAVVWTIVWGIAGYYIWAYLTWFIGTRLFQGTAEPGELMRTLGYASGVRALSFFSFLPCVGWIIALGAAIWSLVTGVIAVREALNFDTGKAIITVAIGWLIVLVIGALVGGIVGVGMGGLQALTGG